MNILHLRLHLHYFVNILQIFCSVICLCRLSYTNTYIFLDLQLADSRRSLMEEMKQHMSEDKERHRQEVERLCVQHGEELVSLTSLNQQLKVLYLHY